MIVKFSLLGRLFLNQQKILMIKELCVLKQKMYKRVMILINHLSY